MAKLCELCKKNYESDMRFGVSMCENCVSAFGKAIAGEPEGVEYILNPEFAVIATDAAKRKVIDFVVRKSGKDNDPNGERQQQIQAAKKEVARENYARSIGIDDEPISDAGTHVKNWAAVIFALSVIAVVLMAILLLAAGNVLGALIACLGIVSARGVYWIMYAFGELVEKTSANEQNTRNILKVLLEQQQKE